MVQRLTLLCLLLLLAPLGHAETKPPVQIVQLLDLVGVTADEVDQLLQKELVGRGYPVIAMTEKPAEYYVLYVVNSNVASGGAIATSLSSVVARYDRKIDQEILVDHASTVILVSGPDMEKSAREQALKALSGMVEGLDQAIRAQSN